MFKSKTIWKVLVIFTFATVGFSRTGASEAVHFQVQPDFSKARELLAAKKFDEAKAFVDKRIAAASESPDEKQRWLFFKTWILMSLEEFDAARESIDPQIAAGSILEEELRMMKARTLEKKGAVKDAIGEYQKILDGNPNFHNRFEASLNLARIYRLDKQVVRGRTLLTTLEKRSRGTPEHVDVIWDLARAEESAGKLKNKRNFCKWLRVIYRRYPAYPKAADWGPRLAENVFEGKPTGCDNSKDDFRDRGRALIWSGQDARLKAEVEAVTSDLAKSDEAAAKELTAWHYLSTGEVEKAYVLLDELYAKKRGQVKFLQLYATAAARAGHSAAAAGAYYRIYKLSGRGASARKALYQSAFLSYQFRDYDGASQRFNEFIRKYPKSGLASDARWNLAWIAYLKGNHKKAIEQFSAMKIKARGRSSSERVLYWQAMSHFRLENHNQARRLFKQIVDDGRHAYYTTAAASRLEQLAAIKTDKPAAEPSLDLPRWMGPVRLVEYMSPLSETPMIISSEDESLESEETIIAEEEVPSTDEDEGPMASQPPAEEIAKEAEAERKLGPAAHQRRFARAKTLKNMGFQDESKWELFEIEKKVRDREELRTLLAAYEESEQYHRSASIAQNRFGLPKLESAKNGGKRFWEAAYPQAYARFVKSAARQNDIPVELIWGIMKAESQFRRDAISPVGALGLMQIMPATGNRLAQLRKKSDFSPSQLLQPENAVDYGSYYLRRLSQTFGGLVPLTAAAYNAGPHRVHSWLLTFGDLDMDEFIEHIPFLETREYVRRVVGNYIVYGQLYSSKPKMNLAGKLSVKGQPEHAFREAWD